MTELFSLGDLYVSDFLAPDEHPRAEPADLTLVMDDDTGVVHLAEQPDPKLMWGRYWYRSGTNATMTNELAGIVREIEHVLRFEKDDAWVDIASNDGTLLSHVSTDLIRVGVDPVEGDIHEESTKHADQILQEPFTSDAAVRLGYGHAKVVTCIAMFYDLLDPTDFLAGVRRLLDRDGVFVLQMSYTPLMFKQIAFDNVCHEHARYYTLDTLHHVLRDAGFRIMDAQLNDTNGGSFRVYAMRANGDTSKFATQPYRDVAAMRVASLLSHEEHISANEPSSWCWFREQVEKLRRDVYNFVRDIHAQGKTIWGYGASTKGNTLLQYFGLDHTLIDGIAERQEAKVGLRTIGTDIPIYSEAEWRAAHPDYTLMLPWHFVGEFCERERDYLAAGGKFIVPCPRFQVIEA